MAHLIQLLKQSLACAPQKSLGPIYTAPKDIVVSAFFSRLDPIAQRNFGTTCKELHAAYLEASPLALAFSQLFSPLKFPVKTLVETAAQEIKEMEKKRKIDSKKLERRTEKANDELFNCYIFRLSQMKIKPFSTEFNTYSLVPQSMIASFAKKRFSDDSFISQIRRNFNLKVYNFVLTTYACFPIEKITIENFKEYVGKTHESFNQIPVPNIEAVLRNQIMALNKPHQIDRMSEMFTHLSENDPRFIKARADLELELNSKKIDLQTQLVKIKGQIAALKGKDNAFCPEKKQAKTELDQSYLELVAVFKTVTADEVDIKDIANNIQWIKRFLYESHFIEMLTEAVQGNCENYLQRIEKLDESYHDYLKKKKMYERLPSPPTRKQLVKASNEIAQYVPGTTVLNGGKLFEIQQRLEPDALTAAAWDKMAAIAEFYKELNIPVDRERPLSVASRHQALHKIID